MSKRIITNATAGVTLPDSVEVGKPITIQVAPEGKYPQFIEDDTAEGGTREVVQILDRQAMDTLVANFEKFKAESEAKGQKYGVLVDADHSSEISTNTAAMAWVTRLYVDDEKGLMAEIEPTSLGAERINGKVYRFVSGAWTLDDEYRPETLVSIGLTNKPNLPVGAIINSESIEKVEAGGIDDVVTRETLDGNSQTDNNTQVVKKIEDKNETAETNSEKEGKNKMDINTIKEMFGLTAESTDEELKTVLEEVKSEAESMEGVRNALSCENTDTDADVVNAVEELVGIARDGEMAQNELTKMKEVQMNAEADAFVEENTDVIPEESVDEIKEEYKNDPESAKETVANFRKVYERAVRNATRSSEQKEEQKHTVVNRSSAKKPTALNMESVLASCGGDPAKENAEIAKMYAKK